MSLLPKENPLIRWSRFLLFAIGILALSYASFALLDARLYQADQSQRFQQELNALKPSIISGDPLHAFAQENLMLTGVNGRTPLGRIDIKAIGLTAMILEGTDARTLRRAVGHIPGTPLPGQLGNAAITGHRDTFFRPLRNIRKDDEIRLTTLTGSYRYGVDSIAVVEPDNMEVLQDSESSILTLVTCYPFYFVGPSPKRFIVRAHRIPG